MTTRAEREAILQRQRDAVARGPLTREERVEYDCQRAWEVYQAERRRQPEPQLDLEQAA